MKKIVVIGGGTGTFVTLTGLKQYPVQISVIVSMMDSGGSTGRLRDQLGVLPPGDLRQCLIALSEASDLWRRLFLYRFNSGDLRGHNFGNIFISVLEKISNNYQEVVNFASLILKIKGKVIPVTFEKTHLCVQYEDGLILKTEGKIDTAYYQRSRVKMAFLKPKVRANPIALREITEADYIIIGPGDLYTSLIPNLLVLRVKETIAKSKAKIIYFVNLMTKRGQTTNYSGKDHLYDLEKYLGKKIDFIIINNRKISRRIISYYQKFGEKEVLDDFGTDFRVIRKDLISKTIYNKNEGDKLFRSILRHDPLKIGSTVWELINND